MHVDKHRHRRTRQRHVAPAAAVEAGGHVVGRQDVLGELLGGGFVLVFRTKRLFIPQF